MAITPANTIEVIDDQCGAEVWVNGVLIPGAELVSEQGPGVGDRKSGVIIRIPGELLREEAERRPKVRRYQLRERV